ncbi:MAG: hypothetical protein ACODAQ_06735 [Phycisphaeraceae bacterium]
MSSHHRPGDGDGPVPRTARQQMIAETSAFLTWALHHHGQLPRIPRRRVDRGGFGPLLKHPGARAAVEHWWHRVLDELGA